MFGNDKRKHFKAKAEGVKVTIWDLEFKLFKVREIREGIRQQHDRVFEALQALGATLKADHAPETIETLTKQKEGLEQDLAQLQAQLTGIDLEIDGGVFQEQKVTGIVEQIGAYQELQSMLRSYAKTL